MDAVLNWLWQGSVVALALLALLRPLERARANVRYAVCWLALLLVVAIPAVPALGGGTPPPDALAAMTAGATVSLPDTWWTSTQVLLAAWAVWTSVYAMRLAWALVALRRARALSRPFPRAVEARLPHWSRLRAARPRLSLVLSDSVTAAAVLGGGAPVIAVAPSLLTSLDDDELDRVLVHEWAHVRRRDDIVQLLQVAVRAVAGWHPAVWWIDQRLHVERELACDEMAVDMTGSAASYAACLVKLASVRGTERTRLTAPAVLRASGLRTRVTKIVSRRTFITPASSRGIAAAVVSALGAVAFAIGGLTLVERTALALPFESVPRIGHGVRAFVPVPVPTLEQVSSRTVRPAVASAPASAVAPQRPTEVVLPPPSDPVASPAVAAPASVETGGAGLASADAPPAAGIEHAPEQPKADAAASPDRSAWTGIAARGTAVGRKSKDAGVTTAGAFSKFARRIAGSF